jgi:vacuolar-type H+-ATPase subunit I/STV1
MIDSVIAILALTVTVGSGILAFGFARGFVRRRLRFVDAIRSPVAPVLAAVGAAILVMPLTMLPLVGAVVTGVTAAVVGLGAGLGTRSGVKALQRGDVR